MLSFSTRGSASHERVDKVREATEIARVKDPSLVIDGEMQSDAAIVPSVGALKAPDSKVAGRANTLIFPRSRQATSRTSSCSVFPVQAP